MSEVTRLRCRIDALEDRRSTCEEQVVTARLIAQDCALRGDVQGATEWGRRADHESGMVRSAAAQLVCLRADLVAAEEFPDEDSARGIVLRIPVLPDERRG